MDKLINILLSDVPSIEIKNNEDYVFNLIPELKKCKGFDQKNPWHVYDVYEHTLHVVDGVPANLNLRMAALFHDIGKPDVFTLDDNGIGHFYGHWIKSQEIFNNFINDKKIDVDSDLISNLIYYHDISVDKMNDDEIDLMVGKIPDISMLYAIKRSDLFAHSKIAYPLLDSYVKQEDILLKKYKR